MGQNQSRARPFAWLVPALVLLLAVAGCGGDGGGGSGTAGEGSPREATLVLDFIPNAVHAGIFRAKAAGYYEEEGIDLEVIEPTSTADTLRLIDAGKADFGLADGIDLAGQIAMGREAKGIMPVLQRPAGGVITLAAEGIETPADLTGRKVGVTGVPSDDAVLDAIMADAGSSADDADVITIGFNGVQNLEAGKVAGFTGYIPAEGVQVEADGYPTRSFPLDEHGGPSYPGLVAFSTESKIEDEPELMRGFVAATARGYRDTIEDPERSVEALIDQTQGLDPELTRKSLDAYLPLMGDASGFGRFSPGAIESLSAFLVENGLIARPIPPRRYATTEFEPGTG